MRLISTPSFCFTPFSHLPSSFPSPLFFISPSFFPLSSHCRFLTSSPSLLSLFPLFSFLCFHLVSSAFLLIHPFLFFLSSHIPFSSHLLFNYPLSPQHYLITLLFNFSFLLSFFDFFTSSYLLLLASVLSPSFPFFHPLSPLLLSPSSALLHLHSLCLPPLLLCYHLVSFLPKSCLCFSSPPCLLSSLFCFSSSLHSPLSHSSPLSTSLSLHPPPTFLLCLRLIKISKIQMAAG